MKKLKKVFFDIKKNEVVSSSFKVMLLRILGVVTLFAFTTYLTHNYDPKIIGQYDFIRTFLLVVGTICIFGTDQSILYFSGFVNSSELKGRLRKVYKKTLLLIFITSFFILLLFILIDKATVDVFFNDNITYYNVLKATILLFFYSVTIFNTEVLRALDSIYIAELFRNTFKYISVIIGSIILIKIHQTSHLVDTFLVGFIFLSIISTVLIFNVFRKQNKSNKELELSYLNILKKSYPMGSSALAIFLLMSFDIFFIKKYYGDEKVAYYSIAIKLMSILLMIMNSVTITISTKISENFSNNNMIVLQSIMKNSARIIFGLSVPLILIICFFADSILGFFGTNFLESKNALLVLIIGQGICSIFGGVQVYLNMTGRQNLFQIILGITVIMNFLLNAFLVPVYGMIGGAISYVLSMFVWNLVAALIIYKKDKISVLIS